MATVVGFDFVVLGFEFVADEDELWLLEAPANEKIKGACAIRLFLHFDHRLLRP